MSQEIQNEKGRGPHQQWLQKSIKQDDDSSQQDPDMQKMCRRLQPSEMVGQDGHQISLPGYQNLGAGTHLKKRLKQGDPGVIRLDKIAKQHDIDYSRAQSLADKWKADTKMIKAIDKLAGSKTLTERIVKRVMQAKKRLKL